jgi:cytochrome P450
MFLKRSISTGSNNNNKMVLPGPPPRPFVNVLTFLSDRLHVELNQLAKKYGNIFQIQVGTKTFVILNSLETIKEALVKQSDSFNARADLFIYRLPPQNLFMEQKSGEPWKKHRSLILEVMNTFITGKSDIIESWALEEAAELAQIFANSGGQPFDPHIFMPRATLSFIQRLIFGKKGSINNPQEDPDFVGTAYSGKKFNEGATGLIKLQLVPLIWRPIVFLSCWKPLLDFVKCGPFVQGYLNKNIEQHRNSLDPENLRDITDGLLKASSELTESDCKNLGLSEKDIVDGTLIQFVGAGTEPPSIMISWALLYSINYPDIQAAIHKELDEVVGSKQQPRLEHRGKLPFMTAFINEIFRHTSVNTLPAFAYATTTDTCLEGYFIPKDTALLVNYYALTRDERYWKDPEEFNPYRFLDKSGKLKNDLLDKFYPFGVGSRRCIGEYLGRIIIFLYFANLMHKCKFEKVTGAESSLEPQPTLLITPQDYKIIAKPRFQE